MTREHIIDDLSNLEQQMLLAIIRLHPCAYGLGIRNEISLRTDKSHSVGTIYAALERLEKKGFVESREGEPVAKRGGRKKLFFVITGLGQRALAASLQSLDDLRSGVDLEGALA